MITKYLWFKKESGIDSIKAKGFKNRHRRKIVRITKDQAEIFYFSNIISLNREEVEAIVNTMKNIEEKLERARLRQGLPRETARDKILEWFKDKYGSYSREEVATGVRLNLSTVTQALTKMKENYEVIRQKRRSLLSGTNPYEYRVKR